MYIYDAAVLYWQLPVRAVTITIISLFTFFTFRIFLPSFIIDIAAADNETKAHSFMFCTVIVIVISVLVVITATIS